MGCPKNQVDTEVMLHHLVQAGYEITAEESEADIVIINTCAFLESAKQESIENILDIAWLKQNAKLRGIIVTGCMAQRYREQVLEQFPEVDAIVGTGSIHEIVQAVQAVQAGERSSHLCPNESLLLGGERVLTTPPYTAYLKIAEGCDNRCTYCAIPDIRGHFRSRPIEDIVAEAKQLEASGVKELVLVAQDTTRYGQDLYGEYRLCALIDAICEATSIAWIRLLYCYPDKITDDLIERLATNPRLCKYIDMPIQHCNDRILKKMNRRGDKALLCRVLKKLFSIEGMAVRTTVICGFPSETEEEYQELFDFLEQQRFCRLGAFAYSREEDTPAYDFADQIDEQTKRARAERIEDLAYEQMLLQNEALLDTEAVVLCEDFDAVSEVYYGRMASQAPEIDNKTYFAAPKGKVKAGEFVRVRLVDVLDCDLLGRYIETVENPNI